MTTLAGKENVRADVVGAAASHLEALFASHAVDASPGILHARAVLAPAAAALEERAGGVRRDERVVEVDPLRGAQL